MKSVLLIYHTSLASNIDSLPPTLKTLIHKDINHNMTLTAKRVACAMTIERKRMSEQLRKLQRLQAVSLHTELNIHCDSFITGYILIGQDDKRQEDNNICKIYKPSTLYT